MSEFDYILQHSYSMDLNDIFEAALHCGELADKTENTNSTDDQYHNGYYRKTAFQLFKLIENRTLSDNWRFLKEDYSEYDDKDKDIIFQSLYTLAIYYIEGLGVEKDYDKAYQLLYVSANDTYGYIESQFYLGNVYQHGYIEVVPDIKQSIKYYKKAYYNSIYDDATEINVEDEESNKVNSALQLASIYKKIYDGTLKVKTKSLIDNALDKSLDYYKLAAEHDDIYGLYNAGCYYYNGIGNIPINYILASKYFKKIIDIDPPHDKERLTAEFLLGKIYVYGGDGILKDEKKAISYFTKSSYELGLIYEKEKEYIKAFDCFKMYTIYTDNKPDSDILYMYGKLFYEGLLVDKIYSNSEFCFSCIIDIWNESHNKDLKDMYLKSMYLLSNIYYTGGYGVLVNIDKAFELLFISSNESNNYYKSQYKLADIYYNATSKKDLEQYHKNKKFANYWYKKYYLNPNTEKKDSSSNILKALTRISKYYNSISKFKKALEWTKILRSKLSSNTFDKSSIDIPKYESSSKKIIEDIKSLKVADLRSRLITYSNYREKSKEMYPNKAFSKLKKNELIDVLENIQ